MKYKVFAIFTILYLIIILAPAAVFAQKPHFDTPACCHPTNTEAYCGCTWEDDPLFGVGTIWYDADEKSAAECASGPLPYKLWYYENSRYSETKDDPQNGAPFAPGCLHLYTVENDQCSEKEHVPISEKCEKAAGVEKRGLHETMPGGDTNCSKEFVDLHYDCRTECQSAGHSHGSCEKDKDFCDEPDGFPSDSAHCECEDWSWQEAGYNKGDDPIKKAPFKPGCLYAYDNDSCIGGIVGILEERCHGLTTLIEVVNGDPNCSLSGGSEHDVDCEKECRKVETSLNLPAGHLEGRCKKVKNHCDYTNEQGNPVEAHSAKCKCTPKKIE